VRNSLRIPRRSSLFTVWTFLAVECTHAVLPLLKRDFRQAGARTDSCTLRPTIQSLPAAPAAAGPTAPGTAAAFATRCKTCGGVPAAIVAWLPRRTRLDHRLAGNLQGGRSAHQRLLLDAERALGLRRASPRHHAAGAPRLHGVGYVVYPLLEGPTGLHGSGK
jgi:hypothetical protein